MSKKFEKLDNLRMKLLFISGNLWSLMYLTFILKAGRESLGIGAAYEKLLDITSAVLFTITILLIVPLLVVIFKISAKKGWFAKAYDERYYETLKRSAVISFIVVMSFQMVFFFASLAWDLPGKLIAMVNIWLGLTVAFNALYFQNREARDDE